MADRLSTFVDNRDIVMRGVTQVFSNAQAFSSHFIKFHITC